MGTVTGDYEWKLQLTLNPAEQVLNCSVIGDGSVALFVIRVLHDSAYDDYNKPLLQICLPGSVRCPLGLAVGLDIPSHREFLHVLDPALLGRP